ncbi:MAG TPA: anhydro-N-acetylmuramic acid kinase [Terriglobales bacterium]|nr:anhydro-N-acetylmuramic acid kinase [Terriglobales bacterium]
MIVAGVMSGTSADGINVALVEISGVGFDAPFELLAHHEYPYPQPVRRAVLAAMNAQRASVADLARLNFLLGELYAAAVGATAKKSGREVELVGCHGQTLYHQGEPAPYLGKRIVATWQTGEGAIVAARVGAPVVSDFRPADMAAGGKGAPLVPFLDYLVYRDARAGRIVQNLGGIANLTAIPASASPGQVIAFDTGPGNMVIDAAMERLYRKAYDRDGQIAAKGEPLGAVLKVLLQDSFFRRKPPRTAGREEFGREFVAGFLRRCGRARKEDVVATATALTARSIAQAISGFVLDRRSTQQSAVSTQQNGDRTFSDYVVSGGGAKNRTLVNMLRTELDPLGLRLRSSDEFGVPSAAKEAVAFALLAYETWHRRPSNIPAATGARRPAILGKISYV